mgnify:CR=1 FL=1
MKENDKVLYHILMINSKSYPKNLKRWILLRKKMKNALLAKSIPILLQAEPIQKQPAGTRF